MRSASPPAQGDFASVLASLEDRGHRDFFRPVAGMDRLWPPASGEPGSAMIASAYAEHFAARPEAARRLPDFDEIAAEIVAARSADDLHRLRRALALAAHPDRVPAEARAEAERVMARANAAIDDALSQR